MIKSQIIKDIPSFFELKYETNDITRSNHEINRVQEKRRGSFKLEAENPKKRTI